VDQGCADKRHKPDYRSFVIVSEGGSEEKRDAKLVDPASIGKLK
jgi:hypothetical protein